MSFHTDPRCSIIIENVSPEIDGGRYPIKREVGDDVHVEADIFKDGHDMLSAVLLYRKGGSPRWNEVPMVLFDNDRWEGTFCVAEIGRYEYTLEAWTNVYGSWLDGVKKKLDAGEDVSSEILEGMRILQDARCRASTDRGAIIDAWLQRWQTCPSDQDRVEMASTVETLAMMESLHDRSFASRYDRVIEVVVDRPRARFGSWYEMFPRSQGSDPTRGATLRECEIRLPAIRDMGFDVLYVPPIHPIGKTNRKGKNNSVQVEPCDPGSPYAIGSDAGGHMAVEPSLGTLEDFDHFVQACHAHDLELAIDFAIQCSPDHPYVREHPEWFFKRPDGTIKYAENPPKKYQDIYPLDFYCDAFVSLWDEMLRIILFWAGHGVRIFRVDNPHTKPLPFWRYLISTAKEKYPDLIFLSEAFTRPKMMKALAKAGFTQSYTYFTWRNTKQELTEYLTELTQTEMRDYFRSNFFTNTPDILPFFLQTGGRPAFKIRAVLAATLCSNYGIYSGFELCENRALPEREEYLDSEKYEFKIWDWDRPGNIKSLIRTLNQARRDNPALQEYDNLKFFRSDSDDILVYAKTTPTKDNVVLVVVNLNPHEARETLVRVPPWDLGLGDHEPYVVHDLVTNQRWLWRGPSSYVRLDPAIEPAHVFVVERVGKHDSDRASAETQDAPEPTSS